MDDTTKNIWNDDDGEAENRAENRARKWKGYFAFLLILLAVFGIVLLAAYRDGTGFDVLRRYFNYGSVEHSSGEVVYDYDASVHNRFAALGDRLAVLSETKLAILDQKGGEIWAIPVNMSDPALTQGGGYAVAYDVGGTELYLMNRDGEVLHLKAEEEEPFIAATLNDSGWLAVTAERKGCKGWVSVYDAKQKLAFEFQSSRRFVTDAYITDDNRFLAAVTLGQENSVFVSNIVLYNLKQDDPIGEYNVENGLVFQIEQKGNQLVTVSDTCLTFADVNGKIHTTYSYPEPYLQNYDLNGDGFTALLLNRYSSGSAGRLVTVDADGEELASLDVTKEVLGISAAGRYLAVLYADQLVVYNTDLQVYASLNGTDFAMGVLMRADGSALLLSSESAGLFLP